MSLEVTTAFEGAAIVAKQSLLLQTLSLLLSLKEIHFGGLSDADKSNNLFDLSGLRVFDFIKFGCYKLLQEEFVIHPNLIKSLPVESKVNFFELRSNDSV